MALTRSWVAKLGIVAAALVAMSVSVQARARHPPARHHQASTRVPALLRWWRGAVQSGTLW